MWDWFWTAFFAAAAVAYAVDPAPLPSWWTALALALLALVHFERVLRRLKP